jgi:hypothetical protein
MIFLIALIFAIIMLRNVRDQFNINNELKIVCGAWTLLLIPFLVTNLAMSGKYNPFPTQYLAILWTVISYAASNCWTLYRTFYTPPEADWPDCGILYI